MKANLTRVRAHMSIATCAEVFQLAITKRPLTMKAFRFSFYTPEPSPFLDVSQRSPDFAVGASYEMAELHGSVSMFCFGNGATTEVTLQSTGNMRGRGPTNKMVKLIIDSLNRRGLVEPLGQGTTSL